MLLCTNKFIDRLTTKAHPHHKKLKETPEERARAAAHKGFEVRRWFLVGAAAARRHGGLTHIWGRWDRCSMRT